VTDQPKEEAAKWADALRILGEHQEARQKAEAERDAAIRVIAEEGRLRGVAEAERDAAYEQAAAHEQKWQTLCKLPSGTCACSYDKRDDVCVYHSPKLAAALAERDEIKAELDELIALVESPAFADTMLEKLKPVISAIITATWGGGRDAAVAAAEKIKEAERYSDWQYATACADTIAAIRALEPPKEKEA
jgi:hypothetical protein